MSLPQLRISKQVTSRDNNSIEKYLQQVQSIPLLTIDQEIEYARTIKQGAVASENFDKKRKTVYKKLRMSEKSNDEEKIKLANKSLKNLKVLERKTKTLINKAQVAQEKLVLGNLRFVISVAKQYQNRGLAINDLINEGNLGLIKAASRFDETRGFKFISYCICWIRQSILQAIQEKGRSIRIPGSLISLQQRIYKAVKKLVKKLERHPTPHEISEHLDLPVDTVISIQNSSIKPLSIDAPFKQGEENTLLDVLPNPNAHAPEENLMRDAVREDLLGMIAMLDDREQQVIKSYFGIGTADGFAKTLEDIGKKLKLTRERVRQIREQAIRKIRGFLLEKEEFSALRIEKKGKHKAYPARKKQ